MANQRPTPKDFVDLINTVMGQQIMTEDQLTRFLNEAKNVHDNRGTQGLLEYIQQVTNAPASQDQLENLANHIQQTGNPGSTIDFLMKEKLISESQVKKLKQAMDTPSKKKRKK